MTMKEYQVLINQLPQQPRLVEWKAVKVQHIREEQTRDPKQNDTTAHNKQVSKRHDNKGITKEPSTMLHPHHIYLYGYSADPMSFLCGLF